MIRHVLEFCFCPPDKLTRNQEKKWDKEWTAALKPLTIWSNGIGDYKVDLTPPRGQEFLEFLQKARKAGARINGIGLEDELVDDNKTPVEWFILDGAFGEDGFVHYVWDLREPILDDDIHLKVKADRMKVGVHVAGWRQLLYVSELFKAVVETHRLTGIEFVWCRDVGKYQALQWYLPVCHQFLGRGLDHPWIYMAKLCAAGYRATDPKSRCGVPSVGKYYKRDAGPGDPLLKKLLRLLRSIELLRRPADFDSFPCFLRKHLPDIDFAYTIEDGMWDDQHSRHRGLAMNRKARDLLRSNRIVTDDLCTPGLILNRAPKGVENLDKLYGPAEPAFTPEQMARLRELEAKAWAEHIAHPKPPRAPDLKRSLRLLRSRKKISPKDFAKPASAKAIQETGEILGREIPAAWQQVLRITNGGRIDKSPLACDNACIIMPLKDLPQWKRSESKYYRGGGAELPDSMVFVMTTELGDSIWLDTAQPKAGDDCRVVLMSHETWEEERDWPTVAEFLEELLTETQEEET